MLHRGEESIRNIAGNLIGNLAFVVGELLIELRALQCLKVSEA